VTRGGEASFTAELIDDAFEADGLRAGKLLAQQRDFEPVGQLVHGGVADTRIEPDRVRAFIMDQRVIADRQLAP